jgi:hypothetical protein
MLYAAGELLSPGPIEPDRDAVEQNSIIVRRIAERQGASTGGPVRP